MQLAADIMNSSFKIGHWLVFRQAVLILHTYESSPVCLKDDLNILFHTGTNESVEVCAELYNGRACVLCYSFWKGEKKTKTPTHTHTHTHTLADTITQRHVIQSSESLTPAVTRQLFSALFSKRPK